MKITRISYEHMYRKVQRTFDIDEEYVASLNKDLREMDPSFKDLTVEDVEHIWRDDEGSRAEEVIRDKYSSLVLGEVLYDWINDDVWDKGPEILFEELDDDSDMEDEIEYDYIKENE